jgi:hypothetical protein
MEQMIDNLYEAVIRTDGREDLPLSLPVGVEYPCQEGQFPLEELTVLFSSLEAALIYRIERCDAVFGCVAWLTSEPALRALAKKEAVSLLVQKEDFLRPDVDADMRVDWKRRLRGLYEALPKPPNRYSDNWKDLRFGLMSYCSSPAVSPVRCVGVAPGQGRTKPNMHHKFILLADRDTSDDPLYVPHTVWTGSANLTENSRRSFENAVVIKEPSIVRAYWGVFGELMALSEPLDWESRWVAPEWRVGS